MQDMLISTQAPAATGLGSATVKDGRILSGLEAFVQMLSAQLGDGIGQVASAPKTDAEKEIDELLARLKEKIAKNDDLSEAEKQKILAALMANPIQTPLLPVPAALNTDLAKPIALDVAKAEEAGLMTESELRVIADALNALEPEAGKTSVAPDLKKMPLEALISEADRKELIEKIQAHLNDKKADNGLYAAALEWLKSIPTEQEASATEIPDSKKLPLDGLVTSQAANAAAIAPTAKEGKAAKPDDLSDAQEAAAKSLSGEAPTPGKKDKVTDTHVLSAAHDKTDYLRKRYTADTTENAPQKDVKDHAQKPQPPAEQKIPSALSGKIDLSGIPAQLWNKEDTALAASDGFDITLNIIGAGDSAGTKPAVAENSFSANRTVAAQNIQMIALQVQRNAAAKVDTFTVQLNPAELGRLDIKMKFDKDGMKLHMTADNAETLTMLQKDTQQLERLLQQSGIQADSGSMTFDLRQGAQDRAFGQNDNTPPSYSGKNDQQDAAANIEMPVAAEHYVRSDRVNITI
jgi:flagellar hook-length control protein FliK